MKEQLIALDKKQGTLEIKNSKLNRLVVVIVTYFSLPPPSLSFFFGKSQPLLLHTFTGIPIYRICIKTL